MADEMNSFTQSVYVVGESLNVPVPEETDSGKVLTAGDDGSASWEDASGGSTTPLVMEYDQSGVHLVANFSYNDLIARLEDGQALMTYFIEDRRDTEYQSYYYQVVPVSEVGWYIDAETSAKTYTAYLYNSSFTTYLMATDPDEYMVS